MHTTDKKERLAKWNKGKADAYDLLPIIPVADYGVLIVKKDVVKGYNVSLTRPPMIMHWSMRSLLRNRKWKLQPHTFFRRDPALHG